MRIFVAGHQGMVGRAITRRLMQDGAHVIVRTRAELDLANQAAVRQFLAKERPDRVVLAAAKVGGIQANNTRPAEFIFENLMIEANVIDSAFRAGIERLLFLGSSCIYPPISAQPITEDALLTGSLEPTNEPYAVAKISGIKLCESYNRQYGTDYRSIMPTNLYGPGDNFHETNAHVVPALIRRFHDAKQVGAPQVVIWGTGSPKREFMHVDDMAAASVFVLNMPREFYAANTHPMRSHINVGTGEEVSIADLGRIIADIAGFNGSIIFDPSKPDGAPRKLLDTRLINTMGWKASISLEAGLRQTANWFLANKDRLRAA